MSTPAGAGAEPDKAGKNPEAEAEPGPHDPIQDEEHAPKTESLPPPAPAIARAPVPEKKSRTGLYLVLGILGGLLALLLICAVAGVVIWQVADRDDDKRSSGSLNNPIADEGMEFTVTKVDCGVNRVGNEYLNRMAQGQFCLVTLGIRNVGKDPLVFHGQFQLAHGPGGYRYAPDGTASVLASLDTAAPGTTEINPGNGMETMIAFDIPRSATLSELELHESRYSPGVRVKVT
ncbi:DUF4352 domain-containing protein [Longispora albida]|uniref:DUF4352 domain-containing protein n=1 Tax=Longispora albida TaxID=203523 RepID=UPI00035C4525|nr:DUF4352 domain-containing protein [Longispora albida]